MASGFTELCVDCADPEKLAAFWRDVLEWEMKEEDEDWYVQHPKGYLPLILFTKVPEGKSVKNRLHIDVSPRDREQAEEVERIIELGARRIDIGQGEVSWVVLADPEDNEFCVLRRRRP
jgi:hypothetical protein